MPEDYYRPSRFAPDPAYRPTAGSRCFRTMHLARFVAHRLIRIPTRSDSSSPVFPQRLAQHWSELRFPLPHGFMRKDYAPCQEHFRQIPQTQLVAYPPQHHETDDIGRVLEVIEACPSALIKLSVTCAAAKAPIPHFGSFSSFGSSCRLTVWTPHLPILLDTHAYTPLLSGTSWGEF
jgi:hypothetical protein